MEKIEGRPLFVDNQGGNTLGRAIKTYLAALREAGKTPAAERHGVMEKRIGCELTAEL